MLLGGNAMAKSHSCEAKSRGGRQRVFCNNTVTPKSMRFGRHSLLQQVLSEMQDLTSEELSLLRAFVETKRSQRGA